VAPAGTVIVDTPNTYLYLVLGQGKALRYGIGVGREGFTWSGVKTVERKAEWPDWTPPPEMIARSPYLPRFMAGGATNPLPFDHLGALADIVVAVDISGEPAERRDIPNPWECLLNTVLVMGNAITSEKVKHAAPDLMVRPKVGRFRTLDFLQASAILRAAEPVKAEVRDKLNALLDR